MKHVYYVYAINYVVDSVDGMRDDIRNGQVWIETLERLQGYIQRIAVCGACMSLTPTITIPVYFFVQISSPILCRFIPTGASNITFHSNAPVRFTCTETIESFAPWNIPM